MPIVNITSLPHRLPGDDPPAGSLILSSGADIWRIRVSSDASQLKNFSTFLLVDELAKADRYHQEKDRRRFITSRAALRIILAKYLPIQPRDIQFKPGTNKKPFVQNNGNINLHYNISHSGEWILVAVGNYGIGVDVEKINPDFHYEDIFPLSFSDAEIEIIRKSSSSRKDFYLYWTRKEALTKATAKGLDHHLKDVPCLDGSHTVSSEIVPEVITSWMVSSFELDEQHIASVAYRSPQMPPAVTEGILLKMWKM